MTVAELIQKLQQLPPDMEVRYANYEYDDWSEIEEVRVIQPTDNIAAPQTKTPLVGIF
jgi:hypothetical protein